MKTLALLCLFSASFAYGAPKIEPKTKSTNVQAIKLLKKIEKRRVALKNKLKAQELIKILQPTTIRQGDSYSVYFQSATEITGTNSLIDLTIDGNPAALEQPVPGLFIYHSNGETEVKTHNAVAKLSIEDSAESQSIRDAIVQLDSEIAALQDQIDEMDPGEAQDDLIEQRDEKIAIKNQLVAALAAIKMPIGEEAFQIRIVAAAGNNPSFFRILSVTPSVGPLTGGTELTITGQRFPEGMDAVLGGVTLPVTFVSATEVKITTPNFTSLGGAGIKSLELRKTGATPSDPVKNATRGNVFFAANMSEINVMPVAVAGGSQFVNVGQETIMNGSASYDEHGQSLTYAWTAISVPAGSGINTGVTHSTDTSFQFTPSKPGSYVWQLVVSDGTFTSLPSLTVVTANPPTNSAPAPTVEGGFDFAKEGYGETQITHGDADDYQAHAYIIKKQSAYGTATVSSTGLVSFTAGNTAGTDTIEVLVVDNGNPPLSGLVSIPVNVFASVVEITNSFHRVVAKEGLISVELEARRNSSHGDIVSQIWDFGDGTSAPADDDSGISFVRHDYTAAGTYTATLTVTDSFGSTDSREHTFTIGTTDVPKLKFTSDVISGSVPLTVNFDASASSDDVAVTNYYWVWGDNVEEQGSSSTRSHTFTDPGEYEVYVEAQDADGNTAYAYSKIYAGITPPAAGSRPITVAAAASKEVVVTNPINFSGSDSFDPNPSGSISAYLWNFADYATCDWSSADPGCISTTANPNYTYPSVGSRTVVLKTTGALGGERDTYKEVFVVNEGHAPRAVPSRKYIEAAAPYTFNINSTLSFDYDGTVSSHYWDFGDSSCTVGCTSTSPTPSYTYNDPGVYFAYLSVEDDDANYHESGTEVIVYSSKTAMTASKKKAKKKQALANPSDRDRERVRQILVKQCFAGHAESCFKAGKMHEEDGNTFAAQKYFEKACSMGYEAACGVK